MGTREREKERERERSTAHNNIKAEGRGSEEEI